MVDYVITVPGYPRRMKGRKAVAELYRPYGDLIQLDRCFELAVHRDPTTGTVVLEYASEGRTVQDGRPYSNHYVSVLTISDRLVTRWARLPRPARGLRRTRTARELHLAGSSTDAGLSSHGAISSSEMSLSANTMR